MKAITNKHIDKAIKAICQNPDPVLRSAQGVGFRAGVQWLNDLLTGKISLKDLEFICETSIKRPK